MHIMLQHFQGENPKPSPYNKDNTPWRYEQFEEYLKKDTVRCLLPPKEWMFLCQLQYPGTKELQHILHSTGGSQDVMAIAEF